MPSPCIQGYKEAIENYLGTEGRNPKTIANLSCEGKEMGLRKRDDQALASGEGLVFIVSASGGGTYVD